MIESFKDTMYHKVIKAHSKKIDQSFSIRTKCYMSKEISFEGS